MGCVYRAFNPRIKRNVLFKLLYESYFKEPPCCFSIILQINHHGNLCSQKYYVKVGANLYIEGRRVGNRVSRCYCLKKKIPVTWILPFLFGYCLSQNGQTPGDLYPHIQEFGRDGSELPTFLGTGPNPEFFYRPVTQSFATLSDYTAMFDLSVLKTLGKPDIFQGKSLTLTLSNRGETHNNVVVSASKGGTVQNFLVGVETEEWRTIDIESLFSFETLYFVAVQDFECIIEVESLESRVRQYRIQPNIPIRNTEKNLLTEFCQELDFLLLRVQLASSTVSVDAWFERAFYGFNNNATCPNGSHPPIYILNVYWPTQGIKHHDGSLHREAALCPSSEFPECVKFKYATTSLTNGNELVWWNYNSWFGTGATGIQDTYDEVLFEIGCGVVVCQFQGITSGTCATIPDIMWYVYDPLNASCPL